MRFPDKEHRLLRKALMKQEPPIRSNWSLCRKPSAASAAETLRLLSPPRSSNEGPQTWRLPSLSSASWLVK